jgi:hypothetical protein
VLCVLEARPHECWWPKVAPCYVRPALGGGLMLYFFKTKEMYPMERVGSQHMSKDGVGGAEPLSDTVVFIRVWFI